LSLRLVTKVLATKKLVFKLVSKLVTNGTNLVTNLFLMLVTNLDINSL